MRNGQRSVHRFFCLNCGREGIPISRKESFQKEKFHRKKLYCPWCKTEVNHIECKNSSDIEKFKKDFEEGLYKEEAQKSIDFISNSRKVI